MINSVLLEQITLRRSLQWLSGAMITLAIVMLPVSTTLMDISLILAALAGLVSLNRQLFKRIMTQWPALLIVVFMLGLVVGITYTPVSNHQALYTLKKYSELLLALFSVPGLMYKQWRVTALHAFMAIMALLTAVVLWQSLSPWPIIYFSHGLTHTGSLFISYIHMSFLMAFFAYLCGVKALIASQRRDQVLWLVVAILAASGVLLSYGRTGYVVLLVLACWLIYQLPNKRLIVAALAMFLVGIIGVYIASPSLQQNINRTVSNISAYQHGQLDTSIGQRLTYASGAWRIYSQHPVLGTGTGSFSLAYSQLEPRPKLMTDDPHNEYLYMGAMLGTPGIVLLLALLAGTAYSVNRLSLANRLVVQGTVLAIAIGSLANSFLLSSPEGHFFAFWCAWGIAALAGQHDEQSYE